MISKFYIIRKIKENFTAMLNSYDNFFLYITVSQYKLKPIL